MTDGYPTGGLTLVWDSSPLHHAVKADRIDVVGDLLQRVCDGPVRNVTTATVIEELQYHRLSIIGLTWLDVVHVDGLDELDAVSGKSNQGEARVLAWAQIHKAIPIIDDKHAYEAARSMGMEVWRFLRLVAEAVHRGYPAICPGPCRCSHQYRCALSLRSQ